MRLSDTKTITNKDSLNEFAELAISKSKIDHVISNYDDRCVFADKVMLIRFILEDKSQTYRSSCWVLTAFDSKNASREMKQIRSNYEYINSVISNDVISISDNTIKYIEEELETTYYTARMKSLIKRTRRYAVNIINRYGGKELIENREIYFDDMFIGEKEEMDDIIKKWKNGENI